MNKIFKFFEGQIEIDGPDENDRWWEEEEIQAALARAGQQLRERIEMLNPPPVHPQNSMTTEQFEQYRISLRAYRERTENNS